MRYLIALGLALALAFGHVAFAADGWGNASNGYGYYNIWDGEAHQPTQSGVVQQERLDGLALPPQQERLENDEVESLYQRLLHGATRDRPAA
jgi:hypothetical protein